MTIPDASSTTSLPTFEEDLANEEVGINITFCIMRFCFLNLQENCLQLFLEKNFTMTIKALTDNINKRVKIPTGSKTMTLSLNILLPNIYNVLSNHAY